MTTSVHENAALSDFATTYKPAKYIAADVCPDIPVEHWKDTFYTLLLKDVITPYDDLISARGDMSEIDYETAKDTYECLDRGNSFSVPWKEQQDADPVLTQQRRKLGLVLNNLLLRREIRVADLYDTTTSYASANRIDATATGGAAWSDETNGDPIVDMHAALEAIDPGAEGDTELHCIITLELWHEASRHPRLTGKMALDDEGLVKPASFAAFFGIDKLHITKAQKNTANRGATVTKARIWDTDKVRLVRLPTSIPRPDTAMFAGRFTVVQGGARAIETAVSMDELQFAQVIEWMDPSKGVGAGTLFGKCTLSESDPKVLQNDMGAVIHSA